MSCTIYEIYYTGISKLKKNVHTFDKKLKENNTEIGRLNFTFSIMRTVRTNSK